MNQVETHLVAHLAAAQQRIERLEGTLLAIYDTLPVFIKAAIQNQKIFSQAATVEKLMDSIRNDLATPPDSHQQSDR